MPKRTRHIVDYEEWRRAHGIYDHRVLAVHCCEFFRKQVEWQENCQPEIEAEIAALKPHIERLGEIDRALIELKLKRVRQDDIARMLGMCQGNVSWRTQRVILQLRYYIACPTRQAMREECKRIGLSSTETRMLITFCLKCKGNGLLYADHVMIGQSRVSKILNALRPKLEGSWLGEWVEKITRGEFRWLSNRLRRERINDSRRN